VDVTIEGQQEQIGGQNPTSHAVNSRRVHTMIDGDTLQSVAYRELGKPAYWRAIADLNGIDDPLRLPAGTVLLIPSLADAAGPLRPRDAAPTATISRLSRSTAPSWRRHRGR
jgi:hypothetical protein